MKVPFYSVLGPLLRSNHKSIRRLCSYPIINYSKPYVGFLGIVGVILSLFDIIRIVRCGSILPGYLWRERLKQGQVVVSPEIERDCKLICLVLSTEYYTFLIMGLITENAIFFLPFLILYAAILIIEFIIFFLRLLITNGSSSKGALFMSSFMAFNWISVFCTFARLTNGCDI